MTLRPQQPGCVPEVVDCVAVPKLKQVATARAPPHQARASVQLHIDRLSGRSLRLPGGSTTVEALTDNNTVEIVTGNHIASKS